LVWKYKITQNQKNKDEEFSITPSSQSWESKVTLRGSTNWAKSTLQQFLSLKIVPHTIIWFLLVNVIKWRRDIILIKFIFTKINPDWDNQSSCGMVIKAKGQRFCNLNPSLPVLCQADAITMRPWWLQGHGNCIDLGSTYLKGY